MFISCVLNWQRFAYWKYYGSDLMLRRQDLEVLKGENQPSADQICKKNAVFLTNQIEE